MTLLPKHRLSQHRLAAAAMTLLLVMSAPVLAAPGAHGPNGEHLDAPTAVRAASALPRVEANTEAFELIAELRAGEMTILFDRYASNEPVLGAKLEVESGLLKSVATFRAEQGDYVVTDPALLKALAAPGEHGLVFTLVAGADSDLLDGTLFSARGGALATTPAGDPARRNGDHENGNGHGIERAAWIGAAAAALGLIGGVAWRRQRRRNAIQLQGGL